MPKVFYIINVSGEYDKDVFFVFQLLFLLFILFLTIFSEEITNIRKIINNHPFTNIMQK